jgi:hypothetical protein
MPDEGILGNAAMIAAGLWLALHIILSIYLFFRPGKEKLRRYRIPKEKLHDTGSGVLWTEEWIDDE